MSYRALPFGVFRRRGALAQPPSDAVGKSGISAESRPITASLSSLALVSSLKAWAG